MATIDTRTPRLNLPVPVVTNALKDDCQRLVEAFTTLDGAVAGNIDNLREQWRRQLAEGGLTLVDGSFEEGATVTKATDAVWHIAGGQCYTWGGSLPKTVGANSTPGSTGGISSNAWVSTSNRTLETLLKSTSGADSVTSSDGKTVQDEIDTFKENDEILISSNFMKPQAFKANRGLKYKVFNGAIWNATDQENDKISPTDSVYYRLPQIVKMPSGTLVAFCNELHGNSTDIGATPDQQCNLVMKSSTNNGQTWSSKITIADFGATFQNGEMDCIYNHVDGRIYVFFTSCKGQLGWGYSQAGTLDPDLSAQVYYTYCDGEAFNWVTPINITALFKEHEDNFVWTSPVRGAVLPDGTMAFVISTLRGTGSATVITSHLVKWKGNSLVSKEAFLNNPQSGGEVGIHVLPNGKLVAHSRAYRDSNNKGHQLFFVSDIQHKNWTQLSDVTTSDVRGDLVCLSDGYDANPLWALTIANGNDDAGSNRSYYRVFFSRDLVSWAKSPVTGVHDAYVGYISSVNVGDGDSIVSVSEGESTTSFGTIWLTWTSQNYLRGRNYSLNAVDLVEILDSEKSALLSSGAIRNYQAYINKTNSTLCINFNGAEKVLQPLGVNNGTTKIYNASSSDSVVNVDGIDNIQISNAGSVVTLKGLTGGYVGQEVTITSVSTGATINLIRQSTDITPSTDRLVFNTSGSFNAISVSFATKVMARFKKTVSGWISSDVANVTI